MPPIRNSSVARGTVVSTATVTVYTVPTDYVLLLKSVLLSLDFTAGIVLYLNIAGPSGQPTIWLIYAQSPTSVVNAWSGWIALNGGDTVQLGATGGNVHYWLSGALLPQVPGF